MKLAIAAVSLSLVLHAALVWSLRRAPAPVPAPVVSLQPVEFDLQEPAPVVRESPSSPTAAPVQRPRRAPSPPAALVALAETGSTFAELVEVEHAEEPEAPSPPGTGTHTHTQSAPPGPSAAKVNNSALVHARLQAAAVACYPAAARRFRQQGTVELHFCTNTSGEAHDMAVQKSSGSALLDGAALNCVLPRAAPLPPSPARECYRVPVTFGGNR